MDVLLWRKDEFDAHYNCSFFDVNTVPFEKRQHILLGLAYIAAFIVYEVMYVPCMMVLSRRLSQSCYKFMFYIGVVDVCTLCINALLTGYYTMRGYVYCDAPVAMYFAGCTGNALWYMETMAAVMLASSRCIDTVSGKWGARLFDGNKTWLWCLIPTAYGLYFGYFGKPVLFTGIYACWFFNPYPGYFDDTELIYDNPQHTVHNFLIAILFVGVYSAFILLFTIKNLKYKGVVKQSKQQRIAFLQVLAISIVNSLTAAVYIYMQYVSIPDAFLIAAQFGWISAHGLPGIVYLSMNKSMRNEFKAMFGRRVSPSSTHMLGGGGSSANEKSTGKVPIQTITNNDITLH